MGAVNDMELYTFGKGQESQEMLKGSVVQMSGFQWFKATNTSEG